MLATDAIPLGCSPLSLVGTVNAVQTLKVVNSDSDDYVEDTKTGVRCSILDRGFYSRMLLDPNNCLFEARACV
jgi:hypothetical protein